MLIYEYNIGLCYCAYTKFKDDDLTRILEHNCLVNKLLVGGWRLLKEITANCFLLFLELLQ